MWFRVASVVVEMFHVVSCGQCGRGFVWPASYSRCFMWFRVACVVLEMFHLVRVTNVVVDMLHVVPCGQRGCMWMWFRVAVVLEMFHLVRVTNVVVDMLHVVPCGQRGCMWMWFRVASVVVEMLHVDSCGQRGSRDVSYVFEWLLWSRDVSYGFVWPARYSRCFMWFRVTTVAVDMFHVVPCGQRGCGFAWPVWNARCCMLFRVACIVFEMFHAFKVSKQMMKNHICFASFDEASAADEPSGTARAKVLALSHSYGKLSISWAGSGNIPGSSLAKMVRAWTSLRDQRSVETCDPSGTS
eukprot:s3616_g7.t1